MLRRSSRKKKKEKRKKKKEKRKKKKEKKKKEKRKKKERKKKKKKEKKKEKELTRSSTRSAAPPTTCRRPGVRSVAACSTIGCAPPTANCSTRWCGRCRSAADCIQYCEAAGTLKQRYCFTGCRPAPNCFCFGLPMSHREVAAMSRSKQTSKGRGRRKVVTALGVAGALSLAGGAQSRHPHRRSRRSRRHRRRRDAAALRKAGLPRLRSAEVGPQASGGGQAKAG